MGRLLENGLAFAGGVRLGQVLEAEDGEPLFTKPAGGVKRFMPGARGGGIQSRGEDRVPQGGHQEVLATGKNMG